MKGVFCYLPILRAKQGEFRACGKLSPQAKTRTAVLFDIPVPALRGGKTLDDYFAGPIFCWTFASSRWVGR
jgi:hypothetical protein